MNPQDDQQETRRRWLLEATGLPTAAGREERVVAWVERWVGERADLTLERDEAGNLLIGRSGAGQARAAGGTGPILFTAHLDHPAFVIERVESERCVRTTFRGGALEPYFSDGRVRVLLAGGDEAHGTIESTTAPNAAEGRPLRECVIALDEPAPGARQGDIAVWDLPAPTIEDDVLRAPVCDDLAAMVAALAALDALRQRDDAAGRDVRILLTRAEEVGFVGAIAACRLGTIPAGSRVIALENSRSFHDSPIGAGPIVRVGDRLTTFSPTLTAAVAKTAASLAGEVETKVGDASAPAPRDGFRWQRKLMPGGACEASAFCAYGHEATCVCLPLGNYHNMADLDRVQPALRDGLFEGEAAIAPEFISVSDFEGLVELLIACGLHLEEAEPMRTRMERLYEERKFVL